MPSPNQNDEESHIQNCALAVVEAGFDCLAGWDGYSYGALAGHNVRSKLVSGREMTLRLDDDFTVIVTVTVVKVAEPEGVPHNN